MFELLISQNAVAKYLGVHPNALSVLFKYQGPPYFCDGTKRIYKKEDVDRWAENSDYIKAKRAAEAKNINYIPAKRAAKKSKV